MNTVQSSDTSVIFGSQQFPRFRPGLTEVKMCHIMAKSYCDNNYLVAHWSLLSKTAVMGRVQGLWLLNPKSVTEGERVGVRHFQGFENFYPGTIASVRWTVL